MSPAREGQCRWSVQHPEIRQHPPPPTEFKNKPTGSANMVAEHSFEGNGFWMVVEEEVAPALTFGADPDPILGDLDDLGASPQDFEPRFTWDGPDNWLCDEAIEIEEEEREGKLPESPGHTNEVPLPRDTSLPQGALKPLDGLSPELILAPVDAEGHSESLLDEAPQHTTWHESQRSAWAFKGTDPSGEEYPLNLLNSYFEDIQVLEPNIALQEARRLIFDEGVHA
jgi:hypothetical protein